ncbi:MAG TPA: hypothetical protein VFO20_00255 [Propionibacteriaceae bacterium]|nr:hypothetical protein [Propionibacteriaceae bacterium]
MAKNPGGRTWECAQPLPCMLAAAGILVILRTRQLAAVDAG